MIELTEHEKEYTEMWIALVFLLVLSISFGWLTIPHWLAVGLLFGVALLKAYLVVKNFMHFTKEASILIISIASTFALLGIFLLLMWPDFGIRATDLSLLK